MKKLIFVFCLAFVLCFCGCGAESDDTQTDVQGDTVQSEQAEQTEQTEQTDEGKADSSGNASEGDSENSLPSYAELAGHYQDRVTMRATSGIEETEDGVSIIVSWSSTASECVTWQMTAHYDENGHLAYNDETVSLLTLHENEEEDVEIISTGGSGYFEVEDGVLKWTGSADESCQVCEFEKLPE